MNKIFYVAGSSVDRDRGITNSYTFNIIAENEREATDRAFSIEKANLSTIKWTRMQALYPTLVICLGTEDDVSSLKELGYAIIEKSP